MAKEYIKIVFSENDIKELIAEKHGLDLNSTVIIFNYYEGSIVKSAYTTVTVEGQKPNKVNV